MAHITDKNDKLNIFIANMGLERPSPAESERLNAISKVNHELTMAFDLDQVYDVDLSSVVYEIAEDLYDSGRRDLTDEERKKIHEAYEDYQYRFNRVPEIDLDSILDDFE